MSLFAAEPPTTVRQQSPRRLPKRAYLAIFLVAAVAAYSWKYHHLPPPAPAVPSVATATVRIHHPTFTGRQAWQEIVAHAKAEVRDNLKIGASGRAMSRWSPFRWAISRGKRSRRW